MQADLYYYAIDPIGDSDSDSDDEGSSREPLIQTEGSVNSNRRRVREKITLFKKALKKLFGQSWPTVSSSLFVIGNSFIITFLTSHIKDPDVSSDDYLAASSLITMGQLLVVSTIRSFAYPIPPFVGKKMGKKKHEDIGGVVHAATATLIVLSGGAISILLNAERLYNLAGQNPQLTELAQGYFNTSVVGVPAFLVVTALQQFLIGIERPRAVFVSTAVNTALLAGFGYLLVNGIGFIPALHLKGLGYAYSGANWLNLVGLIVFCKYGKELHQDIVFSFSWSKFKKRLRKELVKGLEISVHISSELITVMVLTIFAGLFGDKILAANQVADLYITLLVNGTMAFAQTTSGIISRYNGANKPYKARCIGNVANLVGLISSSLYAVTLIIYYKELSYFLLPKSLQENNEDFDQMLQHVFLIASIAGVLDCVRNVSAGTLRGYLATRVPMILSLICMCGISLGSGYYLGFERDLGIEGVYYGRALGIFLGAVATLSYWLHIANTSEKVVNINQQEEITFGNVVNNIPQKQSKQSDSSFKSAVHFITTRFGHFCRKTQAPTGYTDSKGYVIVTNPIDVQEGFDVSSENLSNDISKSNPKPVEERSWSCTII